MGLFKHKGGKAHKFTFSLHVHTVGPLPSAPRGAKLVVSFERGKHTGTTRPAAAAGAPATYAFNEQLVVPCTLYEEAAAGRRAGAPAFSRKEVTLTVAAADPRSGRPLGAPLGTLTLNLADWAAADGRTQQAFTLVGPGGASLAPAGSVGGAPKLVLSVGCAMGKGAAAVEASLSSLSASAAAAALAEVEEEGGGYPMSLSTDEEGGSRPSSRANSRPGSRAAAAGGAPPALAAVAEEGGGGGAVAAEAAAQEASAQYDADGFLIDESLATEDASREASGSVRRNLGSALERAEASQASQAAGMEGEAEAASGLAAAEVQSRLSGSSSFPRAGIGAARLGTNTFPRGGTGAVAAAAVVAELATGSATPDMPTHLDARPAGLQPPDAAYSTGQLSSLSAAGDPAVPFTVPPSTQRRFAQRGEDGGAAGRRWAWRRAGGAGGAAAGSMFQRARIASVSKHDSADGASGGEGPARSASSGAPSAELSSRRTTSEDAVAQRGAPSEAQQGAAPAASESQLSEGASAVSVVEAVPAAAGQPVERSGAGLGRPSVDAASAAATLAVQRPTLYTGGSLRPSLSLFDSLVLPSPVDQPAAPSGPQQLVEALAHELRLLAALESAVYLAGGRKAFGGGGAGAGGSSRHLHAPARRLARTILSLGPHDGLAFGLHAIRAIESTAGAGSGDLHRLTFWWSNVLQLRWMFWALAQGPLGLDAPPGAAGAALQELARQGSEQALSPRALAAASKHGLDWMQFLLPQLRDLEGWLFAEMLRHLWWQVLLQEVMALLLPGDGASSPAAAAASAGTVANGAARSAQSAPQLAGMMRTTSNAEGQYSASLQGTPRSFETPEEEAVHRWLQGLGAVERALRERPRPAPAPRTHVALLHRQLIVALLRRVDTLLFRKLLHDEGGAHLLRLPSSSGRDAFSRSADADEVLGSGGAEAAAAGLLEPHVLPFQRGPVTFGTGVSLKMAVSRLTSWAADCGVKEDRLPQGTMRSTDTPDYRLFPCLRATADLLMMPKEVLTDPQMRREVVPGMPLHRVCQLLERFEPDDCAPDPLPPGLLEALHSESPRSDGGSSPSPTSRAEDEYVPPVEAALLADGAIEPMSLEMDEESEDELEGLAGAPLHAPRGGGVGDAAGGGDELRAQRFALLRDLWAAAR